MREYSIYYAPKHITALDPTTDPPSYNKGTIYFGIRAQDLLLKNSSFYKECGFLLLTDVAALLPPNAPSLTTLIISNTTDAQRIAVVEERLFSLIPVDPNKTLNPYNDLYNTGILFATSLSRSVIVEKLQAVRFTFVSNGENFVYRVEANSIKDKRKALRSTVLLLVFTLFLCLKPDSSLKLFNIYLN